MRTPENPEFLLAETEPPTDLTEREKEVWRRLAPLADRRVLEETGGRCRRSDLFAWRSAVQSVTLAQQLREESAHLSRLHSCAPLPPEEFVATDEVAREWLAKFFIRSIEPAS